MATVTVVGDGTQSDDIGEGTAESVTTTTVSRICFYRSNLEEILSIEVPLYTVSESDGLVTIVFFRVNARQGKQLQFGVIAQPGTALLGQNYTAPASPYSFLDGESVISKDITILNAHMGVGFSKSFSVRTAIAPNRYAYIRGPISQAVVTINGVA